MPPPTVVPAWKSKVEEFGRTRIAFVAASLVLLLPCFWHSRIQAGDLSSHIYNAWLAQLIGKGEAPGLALASQATNVLFDVMLSGLLRTIGAGAAERIAVSLAVLIFVWGSFAFVSVVAGRRAWHMLPSIAVLAYGWVYHIGFFNFYLSLGLCFGALALAWNGTPRRWAIAGILLVPAFIAHAMPVVWALALFAYAFAAQRMEARRTLLLTASVAALLIARVVIGSWTTVRWFPSQYEMVLGLDEAWVFDDKYLLATIGLALVWGLLLLRTLQSGAKNLLSSIPFHFWAITAAGIFILPDAVDVPGYKHSLAFICARMSLAAGICICAFVGSARLRTWERSAMVALALVFFAFLYRDEGILNGVEDRITQATSQLPAGQRVITAIQAPELRINALTHMIDRACVGHCYSYANYEPSTAQFRVRVVTPASPIAAATSWDTWQMETGSYRVKAQDVPLYQVYRDASGEIVVRSLSAGMVNGSTVWNPL